MPAPSNARLLSDGFPARGAGTDAERRAAGWLTGALASSRREARQETFWCRPNWAIAHAWHCLAGAIASLVAVAHPLAGAIALAVVGLSVVLDALAGVSLGRRLSPERASQNVISEPRAPRQERVRLILTAEIDAGRVGIARRDSVRALAQRWRRLPGGRLIPGALGWLVLALAWLIVIALLRRGGSHGTLIGILQLIPTAGLVLGLALLVEIAASPYGPAAGDNATGVAVAVALARALDAAPSRHLRVELCLQGSGDAQMIGLRRHLRARRHDVRRSDTVVLGIAAAGGGEPAWWESDGPLLPLGFHRRLGELAASVAASVEADQPPLARGHRGRSVSPALPARLRGLPALSIGCLDPRGIAPRAHSAADTADAVDAAAVDRCLEFALLFIDALDRDLAARPDAPAREQRRSAGRVGRRTAGRPK